MADGVDIEWMISNMSKYGFEMDNWSRSAFKSGWGNGHTNGKSSILVYTGKPSTEKISTLSAIWVLEHMSIFIL